MAQLDETGAAIQDPPEVVPPAGPTEAYDVAAQSGDPAAAQAAWANLAASGVRPPQARVFPPAQPFQRSAMIAGPRNIQLDPGEDLMQMAQKYNVPITQAAAAVDAQMRFQAQRGYQSDLEKGMPADQAMAKWGPGLFGSIGGRGGGSGLNAIRALSAMNPLPKMQNVAGRGFVFDPKTGTAKPVTPERPVRPPRQYANPFDLQHFRALDEERAKIFQDVREGKTDLARVKDRVRTIDREQEQIRQNNPGLGPNAGATAPPLATGAPMGAGVTPPAAAQAKSFPPAPVNKGERKAGQTYSTAKGNFTWTGSAWRRAAE